MLDRIWKPWDSATRRGSPLGGGRIHSIADDEQTDCSAPHGLGGGPHLDDDLRQRGAVVKHADDTGELTLRTRNSIADLVALFGAEERPRA